MIQMIAEQREIEERSCEVGEVDEVDEVDEADDVWKEVQQRKERGSIVLTVGRYNDIPDWGSASCLPSDPLST